MPRSARPAADERAAVTEPARAKLNLYLHVTGRRDDGYHLLDSLVAFADVGDTLTAAPSDLLTLAVDGPFAAALRDEPDNLVLRAARALAAAAGVEGGAALKLTKTLPVASGIGGGSADAAAAIRALFQMWRVQRLSRAALDAIATKLGADVPVCLGQSPSFLGGVGERVDLAPALPQAGLVLVNPGIPLPTPSVFAKCSGPFSQPARFDDSPRDAAGLADLLRARRNDLTDAAIALVPAIADVLAALEASPGCLLARMSGSGATCFGLYADRAAAAAAATSIAGRERSWWVAPTVLLRGAGAK